ncbi:MAG: xanthine dehydrogenase small subunit [Bacteroidota bacterium]
MTNQIQFILDGNTVTLDFAKQPDLKPSTTVLNYLRSLPTHKGVKEGCAEGDCGACTVVLAEEVNGKLKYYAVDSCLVFLPMIHGKQLITVENLAQKKNNEVILHPVQEALVGAFGSQCGYCTPGIVMSIFALYKNEINPPRTSIEDALVGNLCRCTGYQPLLEAAMKACNGAPDHFTANEKNIIHELQKIKKEIPSVAIQSEKQKYFRPATLSESFTILKDHKDLVMVCGATDIALKQSKKFEHIPAILDLSGIQELKNMEENEKGLLFGAGTDLESIRKFTENKIPVLHHLLNVFASRQIRNVATLGGNIGSASPIGDTLPYLFASSAIVHVQSEKEKKEIPIREFITGYRKTTLQTGEIITSVFIPKAEKDEIFKTYKVSKRHDLDISTVSAAFRLKKNKDVVENICIVYGGMSAFTQHASKAEDFLKGKKWTREVIDEALPLIRETFTPLTDARAGAEYRSSVAANLLLKFYSENQ